MKRYTTDHEWIQIDGGIATVGITNYAQDQLGDIVYVELPDVGRAVTKAESVATVESTKSVSDIYSPVAGEVMETNSLPVDDPAQLNAHPETDAWLFKVSGVTVADLEGLMDEAAYEVFCTS